MSRPIDADALMDSVLKWLPPDPCGQDEKEYPFETDICVSLLMEIEEAPTIEPEQRWISVAEKEPEEYQKAICTNKHNEMMIGTYTSFGWIFPCYFETPIAWMPLPEPYKGGEEP